jgi:nucleoside-specific outer membrane channel protein Tsx
MKTCLALVCISAGTAFAADWSDTWVGYQYQPSKNEPGIGTGIKKSIVEIGHVSGDKYGTNLIVVDNYFSNNCYPAAPDNPYTSDPCHGQGSLETYAVLRRSFGLSTLAGSKYAFGPVREVAVTGGLVFGTQNTLVATRPVKLTLGPTFSFDVKNGFWDVGVWVYKEWNHNGFYSPPLSSAITYRATWNVNTAWSVPIASNITFTGYGDLIGPKGPELFGQTSGLKTKTEFHLFPKLMFDVSAMAGGKPGLLKVGAGVEVWRHMYGSPASVGTSTNAATLLIETHY